MAPTSSGTAGTIRARRSQAGLLLSPGLARGRERGATSHARPLVRCGGAWRGPESWSAFTRAAQAAIGQWRFTPAEKGGKPVECQVKIPIKFKLDDKNAEKT
jgi:hypothetical protein